MNIQEISLKLSKYYIEKWLNKERTVYKRKYNLMEINNIYLATYKRIFKLLTEEIMLNYQINPLPYNEALIYANYSLEQNEHYDINLYIQEFIKAYKYSLTEVKKDVLLKELLEGSIQEPIGYKRKK